MSSPEPVAAAPARPSPSAPPAGASLTVIGCAGSFPGPDSAASCYLVQCPDAGGRVRRVLLDLGNGALGPLQRVLDPAELDAVLISHLHPDHYLDLCGLYVARRYRPGGPLPGRLPVFGPPGVARRLELAYGEDSAGALGTVFTFHEWSPQRPVDVGPLRVTPFPVLHPVPAHGLRIELPSGAVLGYSGDTDACQGLLDLARDADLLLCEAAYTEARDAARGVHLTGLRAGQAAAQAGARSLLLTHLPAWTPPEVVLAEARSAYRGPVALAAPGAVHALVPAGDLGRDAGGAPGSPGGDRAGGRGDTG